MAGPMEQFELKEIIPFEIGGYDLAFTNSSLFMLLSVVVSTIVFALFLRKKSAIPGPGQSLLEITCEFIKGTVVENAGKDALKYMPFIFSIFTFIAFGNLLGLLPYSFTFTSHMSSVGAFAVFSLLVFSAIGIKKRGFGWLHVFLPKGTPAAIGLVLVPIEIISFISKPFSLTVRLVANMMVGHIMLKVIAGFVHGLGLFGFLPMLFMAVIFVFESGIALLQAYIFTVLSCIYLSDAIHDH